MRRALGIVVELSKVRIAVLSTASVVAGYALAAGALEVDIVAPLAGVFLLACGASALNQYQERDIDALMRRTCRRPLPTGRVTPRVALAVALALAAAGVACLAVEPRAALLGLVAIIWYNGVYTPLKRVTAFAAIPGGVVGAIPPVIGWVAGGGAVLDPRIAAVALFFFLWQVPHFWLLLMRFGDDYARAGLPALTSLFDRRQLSRITYVWMLATALSCMLIPVFGVAEPWWTSLALVGASLWLGWQATTMVRTQGTMVAFRQINIYALLVVSVLACSGLVG
jgi:protoheme IX farnesyltransferase